MPLTDIQIRSAKPGEKPIKLTDGNGLFLFVNSKGGKWWRFRFFFDGKEKMLSFGTYPEVSLAQARDKAMEARKQVAAGVNPSENRKAIKKAKTQKNANTFEVVALEWLQRGESKWVTLTCHL